MTRHPWPWWALVALAGLVLAIPTVTLLTLQDRALGPILLTAVVGAFTAEALEGHLDRSRP